MAASLYRASILRDADLRSAPQDEVRLFHTRFRGNDNGVTVDGNCRSKLTSRNLLAHRLSGPSFYFSPRASIAASTFGGDIGSSVSRAPVARSIALAMA